MSCICCALMMQVCRFKSDGHNEDLCRVPSEVEDCVRWWGGSFRTRLLLDWIIEVVRGDDDDDDDDDDNMPDSVNIRRDLGNIRRDSGNSRCDWDEDDNMPVWPTWAVGALLRGVRCIHINHVCFHTPPSLRSRERRERSLLADF